MAIYHCSVKNIGRSQGRSATGAAAYRSAEQILDERTGITHDYTRKSGVDHTEILAPANAPDWMQDRSTLWNEVERIEKRKDARLCREIEVALPCELSRTESQKLVRDFVKSECVEKGMVADIAFHHMDSDNPHTHILLTTREITPQGFGKKNRDWNKKELLETWRKSWQEHANKALELAGHKVRIDHRTLEAQGIERIPQIHLGAQVIEMEKRGIRTERGLQALEISEKNETISTLQNYKEALNHEYNRSVEASTNTRTNSAKNRAYGPSHGDSSRDSNTSDAAASQTERRADKDLDASTDEHSKGMGSSSQDIERFSTRTHHSHESSFETVETHTAQASDDLCDEFDSSYSSAYDRIIDLARSDSDEQQRDSLSCVPDQRLDNTYKSVKRQLKAMGEKIYQIGIKTAKNLIKHAWSIEQVLKNIPMLRRENAKGAEICVRPADKNTVLVDGLNQNQLQRMKNAGYEPAAVVETSPQNYQAWVRLTDKPIDNQLATAISKGMAKHFEADRNITETPRFGLLSGFTNQKPEHTTATDLKPSVLCVEASGQIASKGEETIQTISERLKQQKAEAEKESRLKQAVEATGYASKRYPIQTYQKEFKGLQERYGAYLNTSKADTEICTSMAKQGFTASQLEKALEQASPEQAIRNVNGETDYSKNTVKAIFETHEVKQDIEQSKSRSHSKGFSL